MTSRTLQLMVLLPALTLVPAIAALAHAGEETNTPVGYWKTIDDRTGKPRSIVRIYEQGGQLHGRIEKLLDPSRQNPICTECPGAKKDKPVLGMEILWGFKREDGGWSDGRVLDPQEGKTYHANLEVLEGGKRLKLFGYIRVVFKIGRSQTWSRVSPGDYGLKPSR